jgi:hypothetical protein
MAAKSPLLAGIIFLTLGEGWLMIGRTYLYFLFLTVPLMAMPGIAHAQATRTWVSGVGDDANPCSRTAPCKTFAGAISKTAAAGEINVLDPGGFGALTITKSLTIRSDHIEAGVLVSGTNGIVVSAGAADTVVLEGLDFEGLGTGLDGVRILVGAQVYVIRCTIRHFSGNGINMMSSTPGAQLVVKDSFIGFNSGGVNVQGNGVGNIAAIFNTEIDANTHFSVQVNGPGNILGVANSILRASPTAISLLNGGTAVSAGPSNIVSGAGAFTQTKGFK